MADKQGFTDADLLRYQQLKRAGNVQQVGHVAESFGRGWRGAPSAVHPTGGLTERQKWEYRVALIEARNALNKLRQATVETSMMGEREKERTRREAFNKFYDLKMAYIEGSYRLAGDKVDVYKLPLKAAQEREAALWMASEPDAKTGGIITELKAMVGPTGVRDAAEFMEKLKEDIKEIPPEQRIEAMAEVTQYMQATAPSMYDTFNMAKLSVEGIRDSQGGTYRLDAEDDFNASMMEGFDAYKAIQHQKAIVQEQQIGLHQSIDLLGGGGGPKWLDDIIRPGSPLYPFGDEVTTSRTGPAEQAPPSTAPLAERRSYIEKTYPGMTVDDAGMVTPVQPLPSRRAAPPRPQAPPPPVMGAGAAAPPPVGPRSAQAPQQAPTPPVEVAPPPVEPQVAAPPPPPVVAYEDFIAQTVPGRPATTKVSGPTADTLAKLDTAEADIETTLDDLETSTEPEMEQIRKGIMQSDEFKKYMADKGYVSAPFALKMLIRDRKRELREARRNDRATRDAAIRAGEQEAGPLEELGAQLRGGLPTIRAPRPGARITAGAQGPDRMAPRVSEEAAARGGIGQADEDVRQPYRGDPDEEIATPRGRELRRLMSEAAAQGIDVEPSALARMVSKKAAPVGAPGQGEARATARRTRADIVSVPWTIAERSQYLEDLRDGDEAQKAAPSEEGTPTPAEVRPSAGWLERNIPQAEVERYVNAQLAGDPLANLPPVQLPPGYQPPSPAEASATAQRQIAAEAEAAQRRTPAQRRRQLEALLEEEAADASEQAATR